jgi:putative ABC transport system permease protein
MASTILRDLSFALRQLRRSPGFALSAIATLAFGIGATSAIFTLVDGILLRPLPFPNHDRLAAIDTIEFPPGTPTTKPEGGYVIHSSYPNFFDWQRQNQSFESIASYDYQTRLIARTNGQGAQVIDCGRVSANFFATLGATPEIGRTFSAEEEQPGHRVVILSHELWVSLFASSPDVIGQTVKISDQASTVIGVMPAGFHYPLDEPAFFWATYAADTEGQFPKTSIREYDGLHILGRLKSGVTIEQGLADLNTIQRQLAQQYRENRFRPAVSMQPLLTQQLGDTREVLVLLLASVGVVLLIACANVAGLLLARASSRQTEIAVRTAMGAGRIRIVRQLLIEALVLAMCGGAVGVLASVIFVRVGLHFVPQDTPRLFNVSIDARALVFSLLLSALTAVIFGVLPAWRVSHSDPAHALRDGGTTTPGRSRNRLQHALVVAETALGFSLLIGSGLLIQSMLNLLHLDPGFDTRQTVSFDIALTQQRYPDPTKVPFYKKLLPEISAIPGVLRVGAGHPPPGSGAPGWINLSIAGHVESPDDLPAAREYAVMPGFFETLSIPVLDGRIFADRDNVGTSAPVAIVNRAFVRKYFPNENPIGHYFTPHTEDGEPFVAREIIGVVGDTLSDDPWDPYQPEFFLPYTQNPAHQRPQVVMKVSGDPLSYESTVRSIVNRFDPDAPVFGYRTLADRLQEQSAQPRFEAALVSAFAVIALLLSALGLYAVLSYVVANRTKELALRIAFGASRSDILTMVLRRALVLAVLGILVGVLASLFGSRLVGELLFRVKPVDPSTFAVVALTLLFVSVVSALAPAIRAAWLDPVRILHQQ